MSAFPGHLFNGLAHRDVRLSSKIDMAHAFVSCPCFLAIQVERYNSLFEVHKLDFILVPAAYNATPEPILKHVRYSWSGFW